MCLRVSRVTYGEVALRLSAMAEEYLAKAAALEEGQNRPHYSAVIQDAARYKLN
jgi:hypothetical protein